MRKFSKLIIISLAVVFFSGCLNNNITKQNLAITEVSDEVYKEFLLQPGETLDKNLDNKRIIPETIQKDIGTWIWNTSTIIDSHGLVIQLIDKKVKMVYLQINYDIPIGNYKTFIAEAGVNNIKVHALGGAPSWAGSKNYSQYIKFFNWISNYQNSVLINEKFTGIHCDVEPYLLSEWTTKYQSTILTFQDFVTYAKNYSKNLGLELTLDIPFWFDGQKYKSAKYGSGILSEWIIKNVDRISIMAYRDTALGTGGIIAVANSEVEFCKLNNKKITISVERSNVSPEYITFYQEGEEYMFGELAVVQDYFSTYSCFDSFAIHAYLAN